MFEPGKELGEHLVGELMKDPSGYLRAGIELSGGGGWLKGEQLFLNGYFGKYREVFFFFFFFFLDIFCSPSRLY